MKITESATNNKEPGFAGKIFVRIYIVIVSYTNIVSRKM